MLTPDKNTCCGRCGLPEMNNVAHTCDENGLKKLAALRAIDPKNIVMDHGDCEQVGAQEEKICLSCGVSEKIALEVKKPCMYSVRGAHCYEESYLTASSHTWEDQYPLNTFTGETKKELIALIKSVREEGYQEGKSYWEPSEYHKNMIRFTARNEGYEEGWRDGRFAGRIAGLEEVREMIEKNVSNPRGEYQGGWNDCVAWLREQLLTLQGK